MTAGASPLPGCWPTSRDGTGEPNEAFAAAGEPKLEEKLALKADRAEPGRSRPGVPEASEPATRRFQAGAGGVIPSPTPESRSMRERAYAFLLIRPELAKAACSGRTFLNSGDARLGPAPGPPPGVPKVVLGDPIVVLAAMPRSKSLAFEEEVRRKWPPVVSVMLDEASDEVKDESFEMNDVPASAASPKSISSVPCFCCW